MSLHKLQKIKARSKKRLGRGGGSGKGLHTSSRGQKGQNSRAGHQYKPNFAGGENTVGKRLPVRKGFGNVTEVKKVAIRIEKLNQLKESEITLDLLRKTFKIDRKLKIKLVAGGNLKNKVKIIDVPMTASVKKLFE